MDLVQMFLPSIMIGIPMAWGVYAIATRRGMNPWIPTLLTLVPFVGFLWAWYFYVSSITNILDRLNKLTPSASAEVFS